MFGILFRAEIKPEERDAFINFIKWDIQVAKEREPGTLRFDLYRDPKDENAFFVYEAYQDEKAFEKHQKNEPHQRWKPDVEQRMFRAPHKEWFNGEALSSLTATNEIERAFRTKDYELKVSYLTGQFTRMWQRFAFFVTLQGALVGATAASWSDLPRVLVLAIAGAILSIVWLIIGAEDRYLVRAYRFQAETAGNTLAKSVGLGLDKETAYEPVGWVYKPRSEKSEYELKHRTKWEKLIEWRWEPISITHMPAWLSLLGFIAWLLILFTRLGH